MTMRLLRSELFRLTHRLMPMVMLLLMFAVITGAYILLWSASGSLDAAERAKQEDHLRLVNAPEYGMDVAVQLGVLMTTILAASSIATEYGWGTIRTMLARTGRRSDFLAAKVVAVLLFAVALSIVGAISVAAGSSIVTVAGGLAWELDGGFAERAALAPVRMLIVIVPYATLGFLVASWSRTTAAGIVAVVVVFYAEVLLEPLLQSGGAFSVFPENALIFRNISAVLDQNAIGRDASLPDAWQAVGVLGVYVSVFLGTAFWRFRSRDVTLA